MPLNLVIGDPPSSPGLDEDEDPGAPSASEDGEGIPLSKKIKLADRQASYVIVASPGGICRLQRAGKHSCWMGRRRDFRNATSYAAKPPTSLYTQVCKLCWPVTNGGEANESDEASSAHTGDGEEPDDTWEWGEQGYGPHADGVVESVVPAANVVRDPSKFDMSQSLFDFQERM